MAETWQYSSDWRQLGNTASQKKGSIHDDGAAQNLGFRKAFVPGSVVANFATPAILERFGNAWLENGWYDFNFVSPVYIDKDVHTLARDDEGEFICRVETRDGRLCAHATAGTGESLPWQTAGTLADVFPKALIGTQFEKAITIRREDAEPMLRASHDQSRQWLDYVPPEQLMPIAMHMIDFKRIPLDAIQHPGMWAQHAIALRAPILWNAPYHVRESLAEKGISGRTQYVTFQFHVYDNDNNEVAVGRHKC